MTQLASLTCSERHGAALDPAAATQYMEQVSGWTMNPGNKGIHRDFKFKTYYAAVAFVNAVAWIAHREDHHPDIVLGYDKVTVTYATHSVGGLSENDFICAAKVNALGTV